MREMKSESRNTPTANVLCTRMRLQLQATSCRESEVPFNSLVLPYNLVFDALAEAKAAIPHEHGFPRSGHPGLLLRAGNVLCSGTLLSTVSLYINRAIPRQLVCAVILYDANLAFFLPVLLGSE